LPWWNGLEGQAILQAEALTHSLELQRFSPHAIAMGRVTIVAMKQMINLLGRFSVRLTPIFRGWTRRSGLVLLALVLVWQSMTVPALALTEEQKFFSEVWRVVDRAYIDDTFNHQNWWAIRQKALHKNIETREETYGEIQSVLATLGDPFTRFLKPDQYRSLQTNTAGELTGVGLQIAQDDKTHILRVIAPIAGSPADRAGIRSADSVLRIDGVDTDKLSLDEAAERMRGPLGSKVVLSVRRSDSEKAGSAVGGDKDYTITRDRIALNPVIAELRAIPDEPGNSVKGDVAAAAAHDAARQAHKLGYVRLNQFNANATTEVAHALQKLEKQGADGYILDLRNNPGGLLQAGIEVARLWLREGTIVYTVNRQGVEGSFESNGQALTDDPLIVLVNQGTASASEILAGALKDNGRAVILGERTFGKGLIQSLFDLSDGSGLAVTVAKYQTPAHLDINKLGITPDEVVPLAAGEDFQVGTETDNQYQAAVQALAAGTVVNHAPRGLAGV
jgi:carboxyl-terminal processing protease